MIKKNIWVVTLFPEMFKGFFEHGIIGKTACGDSTFIKLDVHFINPSDYSDKGFRGVDDSPYGGGPGMVMRVDVLTRCLEEGIFSKTNNNESIRVVYPSPRGKVWNSSCAKDFCQNVFQNYDHLVFVAGRYEGIDERFIDKYVDEEISIGDYVLTGGELAIMTIIDSSLRFFPNILGNPDSAQDDSFESELLDSPKYTRPQTYDGRDVPKVLLSGNHQKIEEFNTHEKRRVTELYRPDILRG